MDRTQLQLKDDELNTAKTQLESTKVQLSAALQRVEDLEGELDATRTELQSVKIGLDVGRIEAKEIKGELEAARHDNVQLQEINTVMANRLGMFLEWRQYF